MSKTNSPFKGYKAISTVVKELNTLHCYCDTPVAVRFILNGTIMDGVSTGDNIWIERMNNEELLFTQLGFIEGQNCKAYIITDEELKEDILCSYEDFLTSTLVSKEEAEDVEFYEDEEK